jgi:hypothetical protein
LSACKIVATLSALFYRDVAGFALLKNKGDALWIIELNQLYSNTGKLPLAKDHKPVKR